VRPIQSKRSEKFLVFHKTVLIAPRALYNSVPQIDRRKTKGRNKRGKRKPDRSSQSFTCSTNRTPVLAFHEAKPIGPPYVSLFGQFTSSRALRISITDRLGGYRFLLILKNEPKPLREIAREGKRAQSAVEFSRRARRDPMEDLRKNAQSFRPLPVRRLSLMAAIRPLAILL